AGARAPAELAIESPALADEVVRAADRIDLRQRLVAGLGLLVGRAPFALAAHLERDRAARGFFLREARAVGSFAPLFGLALPLLARLALERVGGLGQRARVGALRRRQHFRQRRAGDDDRGCHRA